MSQITKYSQAQFLISVAALKQLPEDTGVEVAFAGRSNAGKSSALNTLTNQKRLARTSKTPGRTRLINLFAIDEEKRLVDLPGYGYAKVPMAVKEQWQETLSQYLQSRQCLRGLVLLMDIRHPLKEFDVQMLNWAYHHGLAVHILLTKADKLTFGKASATLKTVEKQLALFRPQVSLQLFSSVTRLGLDTLENKLNTWFCE